MKKFVIAVLVCVMVLAMCACAPAESPEPAGLPGGIGDTRTAGSGVSVTLLGFRESQGDSFFLSPDDGTVFLLTEFLIESHYDIDQFLFPLTDFEAYCDGILCEYSTTADMAADKHLDTRLPAGGKIQGEVGFQVPKDWTEFKIRILPEYFGDALVFVCHRADALTYGFDVIQAEEADPEEHICGDYHYIVVTDGDGSAQSRSARITGYDGSEAEITLPSEVDGIPVVSVGKMNLGYGVTGVVIPEGITEIRSEAFSYSRLEHVRLPESLRTIGANAFESCNLKDLAIPDGVAEIGESAFSWCMELESVTLPESLVRLGKKAFYKSKKLKEITIPGSLETVPESCFEYSGIEKAVFSDGVREIREDAFSYCDYLSDLSLPSTLESIGVSAFHYNESLTSVDLPLSLRHLDGNPFSCCHRFSEIRLPDGHPYLELLDGVLISREERAVICFPELNPVTEFTVPEGITEIRACAFNYSVHLESVTLPDSVTWIGEFAFYGSASLRQINIPASVRDIHYTALNECPQLTVYVVPGSFAETFCKNARIRYATR